ncbi:MAG: exopolysaccharide biosynthesis polyprenyl glycosylphosphotransferase [Saprospiraceae bacterium]|nr:exopolysaccharide biosynthesis polyprenyl glycosylphosphotransferase [Saprospiraceae bacterium]MCF8250827.1 exopolysaccharide biosynthesis polyprenyl glycosylphosphotransferase [Saprospiraceae bacterium]MCF8281442.1 exopolysaccharide biosynthesis polyprenyl glycosylphosphotransferase [Bacteroidales bacterium]MCF8312628.1 exopolysaccharide biosynthesis polyprenyl glycosylphosphotransferase [Saprospiraceae bacterium]MCF8441018.1 exopolysaccharide biosynthesis polyprenyl glycosylphosphotransfer
MYFPLHAGVTTNDFLTLFFTFNLIWAGIVALNGKQDFYLIYGFAKRFKYISMNVLIFIGSASTLTYLANIKYFDHTFFLLPILLFFLLYPFTIEFLASFYKKRNIGTFDSRVLLVGAGKQWETTNNFLDKIKPLGFKCVGILDNALKFPMINGVKVLGNVEEISSVLSMSFVDEIFINGAGFNKKEIDFISGSANYYGVRVCLIPEGTMQAESKVKPKTIDDLPIFQYHQTPLDTFKNFLLKRAFDILFSIVVLICLFPFFLLIALLIKWDGKGPVFYSPLRKGKDGQLFKCHKFRTMSVCDDPMNGSKSTEKNDSRLTQIGKKLRKYDLDELPQFFNVLKGDMSVVGPRPHRNFLKDNFRMIVNDYMVRHYVKPGISGWAQVNGWRGPTETDEQKQERVKHDLWYIENWSFGLDIKTIFLTVFSKKTRINAF